MTSMLCGFSTRRAASASMSTFSSATPEPSGGDLFDDLVPERHRVDDPVGLGCRDEVPLACRSQLDGVLGDAFDSGAREHGFLDGGLVWSAPVHASADFGVLALDVLADDDQVELLDPGQGGGDAGQDADRAAG